MFSCYSGRRKCIRWILNGKLEDHEQVLNRNLPKLLDNLLKLVYSNNHCQRSKRNPTLFRRQVIELYMNGYIHLNFCSLRCCSTKSINSLTTRQNYYLIFHCLFRKDYGSIWRSIQTHEPTEIAGNPYIKHTIIEDNPFNFKMHLTFELSSC